MPIFEIVWYNRFACQDQVTRIQAKNAFRAGRLFYKLHDRKWYYACIEHITEDYGGFYTEEEINEILRKREEK